MAVPPAAQGRIFGVALDVVLNSNVRPMVHGVGKTVVAAAYYFTDYHRRKF